MPATPRAMADDDPGARPADTRLRRPQVRPAGGAPVAPQWRADRPDVVQVVTEGPLGASAIGAARELGIPVVSEFHTNFHAYSRHYGFAWLEGPRRRFTCGDCTTAAA
jgi:hypothetical protein